MTYLFISQVKQVDELPRTSTCCHIHDDCCHALVFRHADVTMYVKPPYDRMSWQLSWLQTDYKIWMEQMLYVMDMFWRNSYPSGWGRALDSPESWPGKHFICPFCRNPFCVMLGEWVQYMGPSGSIPSECFSFFYLLRVTKQLYLLIYLLLQRGNLGFW